MKKLLGQAKTVVRQFLKNANMAIKRHPCQSSRPYQMPYSSGFIIFFTTFTRTDI